MWRACNELSEVFDGTSWPEEVAQVCSFGEQKYERGNYLLGRPWSDTVDSLLRHIVAIGRGEERCPESRCTHRGHLCWNFFYLLHCVESKTGKDDRVRKPAPDLEGPFTEVKLKF